LSTLFTPLATSEELDDKSSWVNTDFSYPEGAYRTFFAAIGECVAAWASVENSLFPVFVFSLKSSEQRSASAVFYSTIGFRAKLSMTAAAIKNSKSVQFDADEWENIYEESVKKASQRNRIAHGTIFYDHSNPKDARKFFIASSDSSKGLKSRLYQSDLENVRDNFVELSKSISDFWLEMIAK